MFSAGGGWRWTSHEASCFSDWIFTGEIACQPGDCPCARSKKCSAFVSNWGWGNGRLPGLVRSVRAQFTSISVEPPQQASFGPSKTSGTRPVSSERCLETGHQLGVFPNTYCPISLSYIESCNSIGTSPCSWHG